MEIINKAIDEIEKREKEAESSATIDSPKWQQDYCNGIVNGYKRSVAILRGFKWEYEDSQKAVRK